MIYDSLPQLARYRGLGPRFALAFDYLVQAARGDCAVGRREILPGEVWATVVRKPGRPAAQARFEYHERYADIQFCAAGRDELAWHDGRTGLKPVGAFDPASDNGLFEGELQRFLPLHGDRFAILFPGELHAPHIGEGEITRICIKVLAV